MASVVDEFRDEPQLVAGHLALIALRTPAEAEGLIGELIVRCWPGGMDDRLDPIAVEWVRRWSPRTLNAARIGCSCARGRCTVCN